MTTDISDSGVAGSPTTLTGKTTTRDPEKLHLRRLCHCQQEELRPGTSVVCRVPLNGGHAIFHEDLACGPLVQRYEKGKGFTVEIEDNSLAQGECATCGVGNHCPDCAPDPVPAQPEAPATERAACVCLFPVRNGLTCSLCAGHIAT